MKYLIIMALILTGCNIEMGGVTPQAYRYYCPYEWSVVRQAELLVRRVSYADYDHMNIRSGMRYGYYDTVTTDIVIYKGLSEQAKHEVYQHEVCHAYQIMFNDRTVEQEVEHASPWKVEKHSFKTI